MDYVRLILSKFEETKSINLTDKVLEAEVYDDEEPDSLCSQLDNLWCSKSPEASVGFADFIQTFGAVEPNPFGRGDEGEPTLYFLLNDKQKELYGRIAMELDNFEDITLEEVKQVYAALIQDPEVVDVS